MRFGLGLTIAAALAAAWPLVVCGQEQLSAELRAECLSVLRAALAGDEFWPAMHAAEGLTLAGQGAEVRQALLPRLRTETDHQRRCGLAREITRTGDRTVLGELWKILADEDSNGRVHAAESLYKIAEIGDGRLLREALAQDENLRLKLMAAAALGRAGNPAAIARVRGELVHDDREIRKIAAWILGLVGDEQDVAPLKKLLAAETEPLAKAYFVNALACLGDAGGRAQLGKNLSALDPAVRTYSADFAGYSRAAEFRPRLVEMLRDENVDSRVRAAQSLIALSLPPSALGLPLAAASEEIQVDVYQATARHPRYSEGSIIALRDGSLLYATTEFVGGGADHASAALVGRSSTDGGRTWGKQRLLQENIGKQNVMSVTLRRMPLSVAFRSAKGPPFAERKATLEQATPEMAALGDDTSPLGMFFLIKNSPTDLDLALRISRDEGATFGEPRIITQAPGYHIMNNDRVTQLKSGRLICPVSTTDDIFGKGGGHLVCVCHFSDDGGQTWQQSADSVDQPRRGAMEPEVVELADGKLLMIIRTQMGYIATSTSSDGGDHWSAPGKLPLEAPEAPATIRTIPSTGDLLLVWNSSFVPGSGHGGRRTPLTAAISTDQARSWQHVRHLETSPDHGFAYTSILFHKDRVLLSYYVHDAKSGRISSRFRSLPVSWLYEQ
jgi:sialidase-1